MVLSRKAQRKQDRKTKKQTHHSRSGSSSVSMQGKIPESSMKSSSANKRRRTGGNIADNTMIENRFIEFIKTQQENDEEGGNNVEDKEIARLEAKLGLKGGKGKTKLQQEYENDGLGGDFVDFLTDLDRVSTLSKNKKRTKRGKECDQSDDEDLIDEDGDDIEMDDATREEFERIQKEDAEFLQGMEDLPTDDEGDDDDASSLSDEEEDLSMDEEVMRNTLQNQMVGHSDEGLSDYESDSKSNASSLEGDQESEGTEPDVEEKPSSKVAEPEEDIYGRVKETPTIVSTQKYIAPHLRAKAKTKSSELLGQINGQLNRLSVENMESILLAMEQIYRQNIRSEVNEILFSRFEQLCCNEIQLMTPLIITCTALITGLYHSSANEIGGYFIEKWVKLFMNEMKTSSLASTHSRNKKSINIVVIICYLSNFEVVQSGLLFDLLRSMIDATDFSTNELQLETVLGLLQHSGHQLRAENVALFKSLLNQIQSKSSTSSSSPNSPEQDASDSRSRHLLDFIDELTHKKRKRSETAITGLDRFQKLKKWIGRVKSRVGSSRTSLRIGLQDLLQADENGRWWVVGGTWVGYQQQKNRPQMEAQMEDEKRRQKNDPNFRLLQLATEQRMNTDVRKRVFCAIMGAEDAVDGCERVLGLKLKDKQEREILRVLLDCCSQEKVYNPYYAYLGEQLCDLHQRFQFTLQVAFWEIFKQLDNLHARRIYNLGCFLSSLIRKGNLSLKVLKVLEFSELGENHILFLQVMFEKLCQPTSEHPTMEEEQQFVSIFECLFKYDKLSSVRDGLLIFFHQHFRHQIQTIPDVKKKQLMKKKYQLIYQLLQRTTVSSASRRPRRDSGSE